MPKSLEFSAPDLGQTEEFAQILAPHLNPGDVIFLKGDLGAGKSALARAIIRALLDQPALNVPSPTFLLALPYENQHWKLLHADLYRIRDPEEVDELGLFEDRETIVIIEWPEKAEGRLEAPTLNISIGFSGNSGGRVMRITSDQRSKTYFSLARESCFLQ